MGKHYEQLSFRLKKLLRIPSNLYIWQHLDREEVYADCLTTSHLIDKWFEQICRKSVTAGLQQKSVGETKASIVDVLDRTGRLYVPKQILHVEEAVGFAHQSILDYFISQRMMEKCKQTPGKRYQVQMFLQNLLEYDSSDFILIGERILISDDIRYYVKYIFYEILGQIQEPDANIIQFVMENCENEIYGKYLLNNVIFSRKQYITILRNQGVLERWYSEPKKKVLVFSLLLSITPNLDNEDIAFIKKHAFSDRNDDEQFMRCFLHDIMQESSGMFELRMMFYEHYPEYA